jgi:integrase/recombinase XerD
MLMIAFRRHKRGCSHRAEGRNYRRCGCPLWVDGTVAGKEYRKSLNETNWERGQERIQELVKVLGSPAPSFAAGAYGRVALADATDKFIADARDGRELAESTIKKYQLLFRELRDFAGRRGVLFLDEIHLADLGAFREEWRLGALTGLKKLERLKAFFGFALKRRWIKENPALEVKPPKVKQSPTLPFTRDEMISILAAIDMYAKTAGAKNASRLRAFVLLLRYTGMRIGDVTQLSTERINGNRIHAYTQKTGTRVDCVVPEFVLQALEASPRSSSRFYFWTGESKMHSAVGKWQRRLRRLFDIAGIPGGHAHRFRDTFAVELLKSGIPMERVSVLLGHRSIRITERHYAPWDQSRQDQLEQDLERAWMEDPIALLALAKGTHEGRDKIERIN